MISGATDYRRYHREAVRERFGLSFAAPPDSLECACAQTLVDARFAPPRLRQEMAELVRFKTETLTALDYRRRGVWSAVTARQKMDHLGLLFGALAAPPDGEIRGLGVPAEALSLSLLVMPKVWDAYLEWRHRRRGFYTRWETDMLVSAAGSFTAPETGWLTQSPHLAQRLRPVEGLVDEAVIRDVQADWAAACARMHAHARLRAKELKRLLRVHHDPFEPILVVLDAESPAREYRRIADEILAHLPVRRQQAKAAAEMVRAFLMIRLGLHLGFRQRNLRELLVCPRGGTPRTERQLETLRRGELRWNAKEQAWEVFAPAAAFKNQGSSFFLGRPYRLLLPDVGRLYEFIDRWLLRDRGRLLGEAEDPGAFFVKTVHRRSGSAAYSGTKFYETWRAAVQRYGIANPWTGRGAIPGLLPHGPHSVRDVLATHVLKATGSYEQASYAIQDTPEMVAKHYGRFLPQDKVAIAARVLRGAWEA